MFLLTPIQARGTGTSLKALHKYLLHHRQAKEAKVWVKVGDRAHRPGLQGPKGVSTLLHHRLSWRSVGYIGYVFSISPLGKDTV